eukprot:TRINITY_DN2821_c0_g1_i2.p1 TRINITY_DN2821_c0_g1~~TRINITY_DN2821_c0_g1_i2.p1  ORF type:complete len:156 (+),score=21.45 TRINITY_DN2821_c0_g1_i2:91-558(+)
MVRCHGRKVRSKPKPSCGKPNTAWRAIPHAHLQQHPLFHALPEVSSVLCLAEMQNFSQDSWQWWALHAGRITTGNASTCLGFHDPKASSILRVPPSLRSHSRVLEACERLKLPLVSQWDELCQQQPAGDQDRGSHALRCEEECWREGEDGAAHME